MDHISRRTAELLQQKRADRERERIRKKYGRGHVPRVGASDLHNRGNRSPLLLRTSKLRSSATSLSPSRDVPERRNSTDDLLEDKQRLADLDCPIIDLSSRSEEKIREILRDMNKRYRQSMINSVVLDNEKQALTYHTDFLKDQVQTKQQEEKILQLESTQWNREIEEQKREQLLLDIEIDRCRDMLRDRDNLIKENGLMVVESQGQSNGPILSKEMMDLLDLPSMLQLDRKVKDIITENRELNAEVSSTRNLLQAVRDANYCRSRQPYLSPVSKSPSPQMSPQLAASSIERELERAKSDHGLKIQRCDIQLSSLFTKVQRLEKRILGYKQAYDISSNVNGRLQEEIREMADQVSTLKQSEAKLGGEINSLDQALERARQNRLAKLRK